MITYSVLIFGFLSVMNNEIINNEYVKWWCGTVIVGAIPIFIRLIISILSKSEIEIFNPAELICFGFAIQISCIYFSVGQFDQGIQNSSIINITVSIIFIVMLSVLYSLTMLLSDSLNITNVKYFISAVCIISLYVGHNSVKCASMNKMLHEGN